MRVAIVHDWLSTWGGSETVLAELLALFPHATLFALVDFLDDGARARLGGREAVTTRIQRLPLAKRYFRLYLPLWPRAIEALDLRDFDLVISSSHALAKGVRTGPDQLHVCLCYTPPRYLWDMQQTYLARPLLRRGPVAWAVRRSLARVRAWDVQSSFGVDHFVAISRFIARRIAKVYRREAKVIYPPVAMPAALPTLERKNFYLTVSRLVPYKRIDLLVEAFRSLPDRRLVVIGEGPEGRSLVGSAPGNVEFLGAIADDERDRLMGTAAAFLFAAEEDFGIAPIEAQARGTPVIAYSGGAIAETIIGLDADSPTGVLFDEQSAAAIASAVRTFEHERARITAQACRTNAERFAPERFRREFAAFVATSWHDFEVSRSPQ